MAAQPVELYSECDRCHVEASCVEVYDSNAHPCRFGVPREVRCRMCGRVRAGRITPQSAPLAASLVDVPSNACPCCMRALPPESLDTRTCTHCGCSASLDIVNDGHGFATLEALEASLAAWAHEEQFAKVDDMLFATFVEPDRVRIFTQLANGERIETVADPFALGARSVNDAPPKSKRSPASRRPGQLASPTPLMGTPYSASPPVAAAVAVASPVLPNAHAPAAYPHPTPNVPPAPITSPMPLSTRSVPPPSAPPRAIVYPLVSVIAADGELAPKEREMVDRFLVSEGLEPLADDEFRVHDPAVVARYIPENRREAVLRLMCETAAIDGMPDDSEIRVIRAFATAWHIPDEKVDLWLWGYENIHASSARLFWLRIRRFLLSSRWEDP